MSSQENRQKKYIYVLVGVEKLKGRLSSTKELEKLINNIRNNDHSHMIMCDAAKSLKALNFDAWYGKARNPNDGLWIGKGFSDQQIFRIGKLTKEMSKSYTNNYGYLSADNTPELVKLIELTDVVEEEEEEDE